MLPFNKDSFRKQQSLRLSSGHGHRLIKLKDALESTETSPNMDPIPEDGKLDLTHISQNLNLSPDRLDLVDSVTINALTIQQYLLRSGNDVDLKYIKQLMNQCEIEGFSGDSDVDFATFYYFMTSFLVSDLQG